jgi:ATP-dependent DNA helicase RecG
MISNEENKMGRSLPINSLLILSALKSERRLDVHRIAEMINISENRTKSNVEKLVESGLIEAVDNGKSRVYILSSKVYRENDNAVGYVRQTGIDSIKYEELVLKLAREQKGSITRDNVIELLNVSDSQAYRILKKLADAGKLILEGKGRGSNYKLVKK